MDRVSDFWNEILCEKGSSALTRTESLGCRAVIKKELRKTAKEFSEMEDKGTTNYYLQKESKNLKKTNKAMVHGCPLVHGPSTRVPHSQTGRTGYVKAAGFLLGGVPIEMFHDFPNITMYLSIIDGLDSGDRTTSLVWRWLVSTWMPCHHGRIAANGGL